MILVSSSNKSILVPVPATATATGLVVGSDDELELELELELEFELFEFQLFESNNDSSSFKKLILQQGKTKRRTKRKRHMTMTMTILIMIGLFSAAVSSLLLREPPTVVGGNSGRAAFIKRVDAFHSHHPRRHRQHSSTTDYSPVSSSSASASALLMSSTSTSTSSTIASSLSLSIIIPDRNTLQSMKVVDLKQLIKDLNINERGLFSKLKRKQELIDYLMEYDTNNNNNNNNSITSSSTSTSTNVNNEDDNDDDFLSQLFVPPKEEEEEEEESSQSQSQSKQLDVPPKQQQQQQQPKKKTPMRMPSTSTTAATTTTRSKKHAYNDEYIENGNNNSNNNNNNSDNINSNHTPLPPPPSLPLNEELLREVKVLSKKNQNQNQNNKNSHSSSNNNNHHPNSFLSQLYDQVNHVYPTLQYLQDGNKTLMGELDVRQRYHPMLVKNPSSSSQQQTTATTTTTKGSSSSIVDGGSSSSSTPQEKEEGNMEEDIKNDTPSLSGDMDIIFIGTASCTPSMTRGVSCTALRLHSLPGSGAHSDYKHLKQSQQQQNGSNENDSNHPHQQKGQQQAQKQQMKKPSTNLGTWLFDCGEGTQLQIQRTSSIRPSKITKIFITHAHGDHSFGLPGLLCLMGQDTAGGNESEKTIAGDNIKKSKETKEPIDIYGPEGLRMWLRIAIRYSVSRIVPRYRVHELKEVTMAPEWGYSERWEKYFYNKTAFYDSRNNGGERGGHQHYWDWGTANTRRIEYAKTKETSDWVTQCELHAKSKSSPSGTTTAGAAGVIGLEPSHLYGEVSGGRDIYPDYDHPLCNDGAPIWEVETTSDDDDDNEGGSGGSGSVRVYAAPMSHGVPCVGYVIEEPNRPGRLRDEYVKPICVRNIKALKEAGFKHPMKALAVIKDLPEGGSFTFPDGTVVTQQDAVEASRPGRKVVICGDTNSARSLEKLARDADVVVHEATNTFLHALDHKDSNLKSVTREAIFHGHSTPTMAGEFCKRVNAKRLILNHFSARYMGDKSIESISIMTRIEQQAIKASGLSQSDVAAAWDFMIFPIPKAKNDDNE